MKHTLTILTPTYNRAYILSNCYESLKFQTCKDFIWLIIDDGSIDNTKELADQWIAENKISIQYFYKKNGGKHTAINFGMLYVNTDLSMIVDSDDILTSDAVESIRDYWEKYKRNTKLCGLSFLRGYNENTQIGDKYHMDEFICNHIKCINENLKGDKSEVFLTKILKQYPFPEIEGEKFLGEDVIWKRIGYNHDMVYINKIIYITEYLEGGLTKSGRALRIKCPIGGMINAKEGLSGKYHLKERIKNILLYTCYGFFAKKSLKIMFIDSGHPILLLFGLPFGYGLYLFWEKKYL